MQLQGKKLVVIVEDDKTQREGLVNAVKLMVQGTSNANNTEILASSDVDFCLDQLSIYVPTFPHSQLIALLDYNMGKNEQGKKRPTEILFKPELNTGNPRAKTFAHFLNNPSVVIFHTGYVEQLITTVPELADRYKQTAFLLARKGPDLALEYLAKVVKFSDGYEKIKEKASKNDPRFQLSAYQALRTKSAENLYDFRKVFGK